MINQVENKNPLCAGLDGASGIIVAAVAANKQIKPILNFLSIKKPQACFSYAWGIIRLKN